MTLLPRLSLLLLFAAGCVVQAPPEEPAPAPAPPPTASNPPPKQPAPPTEPAPPPAPEPTPAPEPAPPPTEPAPSPEPKPVACKPAGTPIYERVRRPLHRGAPGGTAGARDKTAVYPNGYWFERGASGTAAGCLTPAELGQVKRLIATAELRQSDSDIRCMALPSTQVTVTLRKGSYSWSSPCGSDSPHASLGRLVTGVDRLTHPK